MIIFMEIMLLTVIALVMEHRMTKRGNLTKAQWFTRMLKIGVAVVFITIAISFFQNIDIVTAGFKEGYTSYLEF